MPHMKETPDFPRYARMSEIRPIANPIIKRIRSISDCISKRKRFKIRPREKYTTTSVEFGDLVPRSRHFENPNRPTDCCKYESSGRFCSQCAATLFNYRIAGPLRFVIMFPQTTDDIGVRDISMGCLLYGSGFLYCLRIRFRLPMRRPPSGSLGGVVRGRFLETRQVI